MIWKTIVPFRCFATILPFRRQNGLRFSLFFFLVRSIFPRRKSPNKRDEFPTKNNMINTYRHANRTLYTHTHTHNILSLLLLLLLLLSKLYTQHERHGNKQTEQITFPRNPILTYNVLWRNRDTRVCASFTSVRLERPSDTGFCCLFIYFFSRQICCNL